MLKRVLTSVLAFPLLIIALVFGGIPLLVGIAAASVIGQIELSKAICKRLSIVHYISILASLVYITLLHDYFIGAFLLEITIIFLLISMILFLFARLDIKVQDISTALFSFFYITLLVSTVYAIRYQEMGGNTVWLVFIAAWGSDTGAFFVGRAFGKRKLAPKLSPNKTVAGSIGGVCSAFVIASTYGLVLYFMDILEFYAVFLFGAIAFVGSIFGQIGDLVASNIKRQVDIKDFGTAFPGHGGVLDRFDSILFVSPVVYLLLELVLFLR